MADTGIGTVEQVGVEQHSIDVMYARLNAQKADCIAAQDRALASPADDAESRQARATVASTAARTLSQLQLAEHSLCFGRVDSSDGESLYVGRIGLRSESGEILLVGWRAEAARPFYVATAASPLGLRRRRHLRVNDRRVVDVSDEILDGTAPTAEDVIGDGPLVSALSEARTGRMREAAATLQREQDEIVRSEHRGIMVVDGGPGTGKTIVALHRAAYVLYAFPAIAERGVLVYGPNRRFLDYIADVLPSLGENAVRLATAPDLLGVEATRPEPDPIARSKGRLAFARALERRVQAHQPHGVSVRIDTAHGPVTLEASQVDAARRSALQGGVGHNRARARFLEYMVDDLVNELERQTTQDLADFEDELKESGVDLERMFSGHQAASEHDDSESLPDDLDIDWDRIRDDLLNDVGVARTIDAVWPKLRAEDVLRGLLTDRPALLSAAPELSAEHIALIVTAASDTETCWSGADLSLLDEARALVDGPPETTYGHIVVDEAQQLSEMEWRMLMRRCPGRSMTIVGDLAQASPTTTITSWEDALTPFIETRFDHHTLTINYRTTAEILNATERTLSQIAPTQRLSRSIRHGETPMSLTAADTEVDDVVDDLIDRWAADHPAELTGIVTTVQRYHQLARRNRHEKITVVAAPDARGLEFDAVIIIDPESIQCESEAGLRDLYVAQTRATKRLTTLTISPSSRSVS
jgi:DNA helicase IV